MMMKHGLVFVKKEDFGNNQKKKNNDLNIHEQILRVIPIEWLEYESVICEPFQLGTKLSKLVKRGWRNILKKPKLIINHQNISIKEQFDLHHGYGVLEKAAELLNDEFRKDFLSYINDNNFLNPHIMFISKKKIINDYFKIQFEWLSRCEKIFGFDLKNYDQTRLYAFLAERFLPFWFKKKTKSIEWPWIFYEEK